MDTPYSVSSVRKLHRSSQSSKPCAPPDTQLSGTTGGTVSCMQCSTLVRTTALPPAAWIFCNKVQITRSTRILAGPVCNSSFAAKSRLIGYLPSTATLSMPKSKRKEQKSSTLSVTAAHGTGPAEGAVTIVQANLSGLSNAEGKPKRRGTRVKAVDTSLVAEATQILSEVVAPVQKRQKREGPVVDAKKAPKKRSYANAYARKGQGFSALVDSLAFGDAEAAAEDAAVKVEQGAAIPHPAPVAAGDQPKRVKDRKSRKKPAAKPPSLLEAVEVAVKAEVLPAAEVLGAEEAEVPKRRTAGRARKAGVKQEQKPREPEAEREQLAADPTLTAAPKRQRKRRQADPNAPPPFEIPGVEILEEAVKVQLSPRPVPNLGFACLNATLRAQKPPIFSNRDCIQRTFQAKGLDWISQLALENSRALAGLILWNHLNGIRFFRMSSKIFPWCTEWELEQLPQAKEIAETLAFAGQLARAYDQRLTFHPSHFVKLGCEDGPLLDRSLKELEVHSLILDLMGYEPSPENKVNIHIGGIYGDKVATMERFAKNFRRLSPSAQKRLTVENDDWPNAFSLADLLKLYEKTGIPLVFDFHHHRFCPGGLSEEEAFKAALATWPKGVRPVVHWSESQEGRRPSAHSDFVAGPLRLYGLDDQVDVMIEAKAKELALLRLRDPNFKPSAAAMATLGDE